MYLADRFDLHCAGMVRPSVLHEKPSLSDLIALEQGQIWGRPPTKHDETVSYMGGSKSRQRFITTKATKKNPFTSRIKTPGFVLFSRDSKCQDADKADGGVGSTSYLTNCLLVKGGSVPTLVRQPNRLPASRGGTGRVLLNTFDRSAHSYLNQPEWPRLDAQRKSPPSQRAFEKVKDNSATQNAVDARSSFDKHPHIAISNSRGQGLQPEYDETFAQRIKNILTHARNTLTSSVATSPAPVKGILKTSSSPCTLSVDDGRGPDSPTGSNSHSSTKSQKRVQFRDVNANDRVQDGNAENDSSNNPTWFANIPTTPAPSGWNDYDRAHSEIFINEDKLVETSYEKPTGSVNTIHQSSESVYEDSVSSPFTRDDGGFAPRGVQAERLGFFDIDAENEQLSKAKKPGRRSSQHGGSMRPPRRPKLLGSRNRSNSQRSVAPGISDFDNSPCPKISKPKSQKVRTSVSQQYSANNRGSKSALPRDSTSILQEMPENSHRPHRFCDDPHDSCGWPTEPMKTDDIPFDSKTRSSKRIFKWKRTKSNKTKSPSPTTDMPVMSGPFYCQSHNASSYLDIQDWSHGDRPKTYLLDKREISKEYPGSACTDEKTLRIIRWLYEAESDAHDTMESDHTRETTTTAFRHPGVGSR